MKPATLSRTAIVFALVLCGGFASHASAQPAQPSVQNPLSAQNPAPAAAESKAPANPMLPNLAAMNARREHRMIEQSRSGQAPGMMGGGMGMGPGMGMRPGMCPGMSMGGTGLGGGMGMGPEMGMGGMGMGLCPRFGMMMPADGKTQAQWIELCGKTMQMWGEWMEERGKELEQQAK